MNQKAMDQKAKEARNQYYRAYRKAHKERVKEYNARYWKKKADEAAMTKSTEEKQGD